MRVLIGTLVALILSVALNGYLFYSLQPGGLAIAGADTDCSASAGVVNFIGYSDALDGQSYEGFEVGGLSGLTSPLVRITTTACPTMDRKTLMLTSIR